MTHKADSVIRECDSHAKHLPNGTFGLQRGYCRRIGTRGHQPDKVSTVSLSCHVVVITLCSDGGAQYNYLRQSWNACMLKCLQHLPSWTDRRWRRRVAATATATGANDSR